MVYHRPSPPGRAGGRPRAVDHPSLALPWRTVRARPRFLARAPAAGSASPGAPFSPNGAAYIRAANLVPRAPPPRHRATRSAEWSRAGPSNRTDGRSTFERKDPARRPERGPRTPPPAIGAPAEATVEVGAHAARPRPAPRPRSGGRSETRCRRSEPSVLDRRGAPRGLPNTRRAGNGPRPDPTRGRAPHPLFPRRWPPLCADRISRFDPTRGAGPPAGTAITLLRTARASGAPSGRQSSPSSPSSGKRCSEGPGARPPPDRVGAGGLGRIGRPPSAGRRRPARGPMPAGSAPGFRASGPDVPRA